jgi:S1-C subfamily serine protease
MLMQTDGAINTENGGGPLIDPVGRRASRRACPVK